MAQKKCVLCEKDFSPKGNYQKYCRGIHFKECAHCGENFSLDFADATNNQKAFFAKKEFCSIKCSSNKKYGVGNYNNKDKARQTMRKKYGVEYTGQSPVLLRKIRQTNLERYGVEFSSQNEEIKRKIRQTNLERYGVEFSSQNEEIKRKIRQTNLERYGNPCSLHDNGETEEKTKQTNLKNYGVKYAFQSEKIKEKIRQTNLERYGDENYNNREKAKATSLEKYGGTGFAAEELANKTRKTNLEKYGVDHKSQQHIIHYDDWKNLDQWAKNFKKEKGRKPRYKDAQTYFFVTQSVMSNKTQNNKRDLFDVREIELELLVCDKLDELGITYQRHNRQLIKPREIDIYIPDLKLGIEINDLATHQPRGEDNPDAPRKGHAYHVNKSELAQKAGIDLIHVWEDEVEEFCKDLYKLTGDKGGKICLI